MREKLSKTKKRGVEQEEGVGATEPARDRAAVHKGGMHCGDDAQTAFFCYSFFDRMTSNGESASTNSVVILSAVPLY